MSVTTPVAELVEDLEVYPRHAVDMANVQKLVLALESGVALPPVVADARSKRVVDGWHRLRAYRRVHGSAATVEVDFRPYASEAELVEDAVRMNAGHGRQLDEIDRTRAVLMLEKYGVPAERIALALNVTRKAVEKYVIRVARANVPTTATVPGTRTITLKRPVAHLQGRELTDEQAKAHESMPGTSFLLLAHQLTTALRTKLVNLEDQRLVDGLKQLRDELVKAFGRR